MTSPFGTIITPSQVEVWVEDFAKKWFVEYLAEVERQLGLDPQTYPDLRSYVRANDFDHWPEDQLPSLMVMNMGLADEPIKRNGGWDAKWMIGAAIIVSGYDRNATRDLMNNYGAAFRAMILQTRSLEREEVRGVDWVDERPAPLPDDAERTLGAQQMFFAVEVEKVVDARGGTPEPEPRPDPYVDPGPGGVVIDTAIVNIEHVEEI